MTASTRPAKPTKSKMRIQPLADRVVVRPLEEDTDRTRGGLYIPATAKEKPHQGAIIAVGPGRFEKGERVPMELELGQKVLYGQYSGAEVTLDGEDLLIIKESEVLAVIG